MDAGTAKEAVEIIKAFNPKIGGNMFVADPTECYGIEGTASEYFVEQIKENAVKANHFCSLPSRNINFDNDPDFELWSKTHEERAQELVGKINNLSDCEALLSDRKNSEKKRAICTTPDEAKVYTYSAFVFDTKNKLIRYAHGCPSIVGFKEYSFNKLPNKENNKQVD
jgi:hypothetical protein